VKATASLHLIPAASATALHHPLLAHLACPTGHGSCLAPRDKIRRLAHPAPQTRPTLSTPRTATTTRSACPQSPPSQHSLSVRQSSMASLPPPMSAVSRISARSISESEKSNISASGRSTYWNSPAATCANSRFRSASTHSRSSSTKLQTTACATQRASTMARTSSLMRKRSGSKASCRRAARGPTAPCAATGSK
jgi:hypothetical protein